MPGSDPGRRVPPSTGADRLDGQSRNVFNPAMADDDLRGTVWTDREVDLVVAAYFEMLGLEIAGQPYVKSRRHEELERLTRRSNGSIQRKLQNVSAILDRLGAPWIWGYKPLANFQEALLKAVERRLDTQMSLLEFVPEFRIGYAAEAPTLFFEAPPDMSVSDVAQEPTTLRRLVRKFDAAGRDARNRALGVSGEERVYFSEQSRLRAAGRSDLARNVRWVAQEDGDGAGYDIRSFSADGAERLLEVKTTNGYRKTPFYLTQNERAFAEERADAFRIVRLYDFARQPRAFEIVPPLENAIKLDPTVFRASFG